MNIETRVEGFEDVLSLEIRARTNLKREIQDILKDASELTLEYMRRRAPRDSGSGLLFMKNRNTIAGSLQRGPVHYSPGAAGGGGFYTIEVGALDPPDHLKWVFYGTKDYDHYGNVGKMMTIRKRGEPVRFRPRRRGQEAQTEWFTDAYRHAQAYVALRVQELDVN
jgi:hypothetical protein